LAREPAGCRAARVTLSEDLDGQFQAWFRRRFGRRRRHSALGLDIDFTDQGVAEPLYQVEVVSGEAATNPAVALAGARSR
jgi:hypothetical protein